MKLQQCPHGILGKSKCKLCMTKYQKKYKIKNNKKLKKTRKEYDKEYIKRPEVIVRRKKSMEKYLKKPTTKKRMKKYRKKYIQRPYVKKRMVINTRNWRNRNSKRIWAQSRINGHKRDNYEIKITKEELIDFIKNINTCAICGIEINFIQGIGNNEHNYSNRASLDDINNSHIISINNIQIVCHRCNSTKHNRSMKEFLSYCKMIVDKFQVTE